jgi:hypothetical protein
MMDVEMNNAARDKLLEEAAQEILLQHRTACQDYGKQCEMDEHATACASYVRALKSKKDGA